MFERYTEKARRVVFFARYEASQLGSPYIETEHLLLGLLREDRAIASRIIGAAASGESIRAEIEAHTTIREKVSTSVDLPLSNGSKRVLAYAAEEAERLSHKHIGTEHLWVGLLLEEQCFAAQLLQKRGVRLVPVREAVAEHAQEITKSLQRSHSSTLSSEFSKDVTESAIDGQLDAVIGREDEIDAVTEILCNLARKNPVLIGESGVGKTAIVQGLAQRIADGKVPSFLADKRILELDLSLLVAGTKYCSQVEDRLKNIMTESMESQGTILFIQRPQAFWDTGATERLPYATYLLRSALLSGAIQCIFEYTPDFGPDTQTPSWFQRCTRIVNVPPLSEKDALRVLHGVKGRYEKYHAVSYTDEALECAVVASNRFMPDRYLPSKALEVVDAAGTRVKLRQAAVPAEVSEVQKRIKLIVRRMKNAIATHEFEKARSCSDEEREERKALQELRNKFHLDAPVIGVVRRDDIESVIAKLAGVPLSTVRERQDPIGQG